MELAAKVTIASAPTTCRKTMAAMIHTPSQAANPTDFSPANTSLLWQSDLAGLESRRCAYASTQPRAAPHQASPRRFTNTIYCSHRDVRTVTLCWSSPRSTGSRGRTFSFTWAGFAPTDFAPRRTNASASAQRNPGCCRSAPGLRIAVRLRRSNRTRRPSVVQLLELRLHGLQDAANENRHDRWATSKVLRLSCHPRDGHSNRVIIWMDVARLWSRPQ